MISTSSFKRDTRRRIAFACGLMLALAASPVLAQSNAAHAESLFKEGKELLAQKKYEQACPKLAESARLDPGSGTLLALGLCYEGQGKFASAWGAYIEASAAARRDKRDDREKAANGKAAEVEKKVSKVTFDVDATTAGLRGFELRLDGTALGSAGWSGAPLDPGEHTVEVAAPGKTPFSTKFTVAAVADKKQIHIDPLADAPVAALPPGTGPGTSEAPTSSGTTQRIIGFSVGGVGIVLLGVGTVFGIQALSKSNDVKDVCSLQRCTDPAAVAKNEDAKTAADISTVTIGIGAAAIVGGLVLVFTAPRNPSPTALHVTPTVGPGVAGFSLGGAF